ncbi:MAG: YegP family protein [Candidatus Hodarchaeota archaeon]
MNIPTFEIYQDIYGKFKFRLRAINNGIVAIGEGYKTKSECINAVNSVKKLHEAPIKDFTIGETTLILNVPPIRVEKGSSVGFSGKLYGNELGQGVPRAKISIYEKDGSLLEPTHLASGITNLKGDFEIKWTAKKMDWWDNTVEVYANFEGTASLKPAISEKHSISVH